MEKVKFKNYLYVGSDRFIDLKEFNSCNRQEKDYYKKYELGTLEIFSNNYSFKIEWEDLFYIYNDVFLKSYKKLFNEEDIRMTYIGKEHFGIIVSKSNNTLKLKEYFFKSSPSSIDDITQEIEVPKYSFLLSLYENIIIFIQISSKLI